MFRLLMGCLRPPVRSASLALLPLTQRSTSLPLGRGVVAALIQIGGLGVTSVGVGLMIAAGKRVSIKGRLFSKRGSEHRQL